MTTCIISSKPSLSLSVSLLPPHPIPEVCFFRLGRGGCWLEMEVCFVEVGSLVVKLVELERAACVHACVHI